MEKNSKGGSFRFSEIFLGKKYCYMGVKKKTPKPPKNKQTNKKNKEKTETTVLVL